MFALEDEPGVARVWVPHLNMPGLAMARALGDFCLKEYGLSATPQVFHRRLMEEDEFIVLASDGVIYFSFFLSFQMKTLFYRCMPT